jgi:hypothetical protein
VAAFLICALIAIPLLGNIFPGKLSFLLAMRYYAGNWAYGIWLFRGESYRRLDKLTKISPWIYDQLDRMYDRKTSVALVGKVIGWLMLVGVLPWATYFMSTYAARFRHNAAGAALVAFYTAIDSVLLAWMFDWSMRGATGWIFYSAAVLTALLYNVLICDWIAERFGGETA